MVRAGPLIAALERLTRAPRRLTALAVAVAGAALARAGDAPRLAIRWHQVAGVVLTQVGAWPDAETSLRAALDAATKLPRT